MTYTPPPRRPLLFRRWQFRGARPYHGGGTVDAKTGERYEKEEGYGIGLAEGTAAIATPGSHGRRLAREKAAQRRLHRRHPDTGYVGTWRENTGSHYRIHYDPSAVVDDLEEAIVLARAKNQKAIWDFRNHTEIFIDKEKS